MISGTTLVYIVSVRTLNTYCYHLDNLIYIVTEDNLHSVEPQYILYLDNLEDKENRLSSSTDLRTQPEVKQPTYISIRDINTQAQQNNWLGLCYNHELSQY